jgi:hypothetical protein
MTVLKEDEFYVWSLTIRETGKIIRKKVELVKITEKLIGFEETGQIFTEPSFHFLVWEKGKAVELLSEQGKLVGKFTPIARKTHCYKCGRNLDRKKDDICSDCAWIKCPIEGACGCKYL